MPSLLELPISIDRDATLKLHRQLFDQIRGLIMQGILLPGAKLPPSRSLGQQLSLSRSSINLALDQLVAEGYLTSKQGSGFFVDANFLSPKPSPTNPGQIRSHRFSRLTNKINQQRRFWPSHRPAFSPGVLMRMAAKSLTTRCMSMTLPANRYWSPARISAAVHHGNMRPGPCWIMASRRSSAVDLLTSSVIMQ